MIQSARTLNVIFLIVTMPFEATFVVQNRSLVVLEHGQQ